MSLGVQKLHDKPVYIPEARIPESWVFEVGKSILLGGARMGSLHRWHMEVPRLRVYWSYNSQPIP